MVTELTHKVPFVDYRPYEVPCGCVYRTETIWSPWKDHGMSESQTYMVFDKECEHMDDKCRVLSTRERFGLIMRTFHEWNALAMDRFGCIVMDPDGFDRSAEDFDTRPYTIKEFEEGLPKSTCMFGANFFAKWKKAP
jgi:hypothetical protein